MQLRPRFRRRAMRIYWTLSLTAWVTPVLLLFLQLTLGPATDTGSGRLNSADAALVILMAFGWLLGLAFIYGFGLLVQTALLVQSHFDEPVGELPAGKPVDAGQAHQEVQ